MLLYKFSMSGKNIHREEIEVVEKEKIYEETKGLTKCRYKKDDLDKPLYTGYSNTPYMYSLNGNLEPFVRIVIEYKRQQADMFERKMIKEKNEIIEIQKQFERILNNNIMNNTYRCSYEINFSYDDKQNTRIKGTGVKCEKAQEIPITNIVQGFDVINRIKKEEDLNLKINNIFVDGSKTNLILQDFQEITKDNDTQPCIISLEKLEDICQKAKVEIDISIK